MRATLVIASAALCGVLLSLASVVPGNGRAPRSAGSAPEEWDTAAAPGHWTGSAEETPPEQAGGLPDGRVGGSAEDLAAELFALLDLDGDGFLDAGEMTAALRARLGRWDADGDGRIDSGEFLAYFEDRVAQSRTAPGRQSWVA